MSALRLPHKRKVLLVLCCLPALAACSQAFNFKAFTYGVTAASMGYFSREDVNLKEKNYAAADYMVSQMQEYVGRGDVILMKPLTETDHAVTSPLGMKVPEEIGLRLSELGYNVALHRVATGANAGLYAAPQEKEKFIFGGHYLRERNKAVKVYLRVSEVATGRVVASFDYSMPVTREVRALSDTPTRIFKVEPDY